MPAKSLDQIVSLCKQRGFIFPGSEIYGGLANTWDYGPIGVELKNRQVRSLQQQCSQKQFISIKEDAKSLTHPDLLSQPNE